MISLVFCIDLDPIKGDLKRRKGLPLSFPSLPLLPKRERDRHSSKKDDDGLSVVFGYFFAAIRCRSGTVDVTRNKLESFIPRSLYGIFQADRALAM